MRQISISDKAAAIIFGTCPTGQALGQIIGDVNIDCARLLEASHSGVEAAQPADTRGMMVRDIASRVVSLYKEDIQTRTELT